MKCKKIATAILDHDMKGEPRPTSGSLSPCPGVWKSVSAFCVQPALPFSGLFWSEWAAARLKGRREKMYDICECRFSNAGASREAARGRKRLSFHVIVQNCCSYLFAFHSRSRILTANGLKLRSKWIAEILFWKNSDFGAWSASTPEDGERPYRVERGSPFMT